MVTYQHSTERICCESVLDIGQVSSKLDTAVHHKHPQYHIDAFQHTKNDAEVYCKNLAV